MSSLLSHSFEVPFGDSRCTFQYNFEGTLSLYPEDGSLLLNTHVPNKFLGMQTRNQFLSGLVPLTDLRDGSDINCSICLELFTEPCRLPCGHIFCKSCVVQRLRRRGRSTCPTCRQQLIVLDEAERDPVGLERRQVVAQALTHSRLLTNGFDAFNDEIVYTASAVQRAAAAANLYLADEHHSPITGPVFIDTVYLGPHLIAIGNLLRGYATAVGRPYSQRQEREWKTIVARIYDMLEHQNGETGRGSRATTMAQQLRTEVSRILRGDGMDVASSQFFDQDALVESPSGDLDLLLAYVVFQCAKRYGESVRKQVAGTASSRGGGAECDDAYWWCD